MYTHSKQLITAGVPLHQAEKAVIMIHGRGASASGIISLQRNLLLPAIAVIAPEATHRSWYPYSFMAPVKDNEPALSSALETIGQIVDDILMKGIPLSKLYFLGFSQGACLSLEYVCRNATRYGGVIALTGGLIGEHLIAENYSGDFSGTPVLLTTGNPDPHVPLERVEETVSILERLKASVLFKVYDGRPHTILEEELELANEHVLSR
jgi:phospholipase/carboxylesterase